MKSCGVDNELMPISSLKKEVIDQALLILKDISAVVTEMDELKKIGMRADIDEVEAVKSKCAKLSSSFYELIPYSEGKNEVTQPIQNLNLLQKRF